MCSPGETGALLGENEFEKKEWGETFVCIEPAVRNRASLRAFISSARWMSAMIAGSSVVVRETVFGEYKDNSITFVC